jgi:uncharacterized protein YuzE
LDEADLRMAVDPFMVLNSVAGRVKKQVWGKIISLDYDEEADVLYVLFKHNEGVDSEALDEEGYVIGKLNQYGEVVGLTILDASAYDREDSEA